MVNPTWEEEFGPRRKDPRRQLQGARNKALGEYLEETLSRTCLLYRERGLAYIEKTPEPMRPTRNLGNWRFEAHFVGRAQPDYKGTLRGGRAVVLEAKAASGASIRRERVTAAQMEALETHSRLGALALVVVWLEGRGIYAVPWELWRDMKEKTGRASLSYRELEPYRAPLRQGVWDFLRLIDDGGVGR